MPSGEMYKEKIVNWASAWICYTFVLIEKWKFGIELCQTSRLGDD